jgi:hypothetical protein
MHSLRAKLLGDDARLDNIRLGSVAAVISRNRPAVVTVLNQYALPIFESLAPETIAGLGLSVFVVPDKGFDFLTESVVVRAVC